MSFVSDNTTPMMRCAVGMKTEDDADGSLVGVGTTTGVGTPASVAPAPPARPAQPKPHFKRPTVTTNRRWK